MARDSGALKTNEGNTIRNFFPSYRVFIEGTEVTNLVTSVRPNWSPANPHSVTIELANPNQIMTLTAVDMCIIAAYRNSVLQTILSAIFATGATGVSIPPADNVNASSQLLPAGTILPLQTLDSTAFSQVAQANGALTFPPYSQGNAPIMPPMTAALNNLKTTILVPKLQTTYQQSTIQIDGSSLPSEIFFKYPMVQGKWIWHFSDRVRVAFRDVVDPTVWYWMHAGTITDTNERENEDQQSVITITSEGVLKDLRNARIQNATGTFLSADTLSTGAFSAPSAASSQESAFTTQQLSQITTSPVSSFLQNMTLTSIVETLLFGSTSAANSLSQSVTASLSNQSPAVIAETLGIPSSDGSGTATASDITAYENSVRGLNVSAAGNFKMASQNQGTDVYILGSMGAFDAASGCTQTTLPLWQAVIDHQVSPDDVSFMARGSTVLTGATSNTSGAPVGQAQSNQSTQQSVTLPGSSNTPASESGAVSDTYNQIQQVITKIGSDPDTYPIEQYVRMLLPAQLTSLIQRAVLDRDLTHTVGTVSEFYDRLSLLHQVTDRLEFVLYDTPKGDIIIEMPLYDFEPRHWSSNGSLTSPLAESLAAVTPLPNEQAFPELVNVQAALSEINAATTDTTSFDLNYRIFPWEQISIDLTASDQDVKTVWSTVPRWTQADASDNSQSTRQQVVVALPNLIPLYGFRYEQGGQESLITTQAAAQVYCNLMLNKTNADTMSARVPCAPNWRAWLNRPVLVDSRNFLGVTKSISHSIVWQSDCSTEYGFWHFKFWDGRFTTDAAGNACYLFAPFGGVNSQPFNYSYLLQINNLATDLSKSSTNGGQIEATLSQVLATPQRTQQ